LRFDLPAEKKRIDLAELTLAMSRGADVRPRIEKLEPQYTQYALLKDALAKYRTIAADASLHPPPAATTSVRPGERWSGSPALRRLLIALGDLPASASSPDSEPVRGVYDSSLAEGVRRFQWRHGLDVDGILGRSTVQALRQPLSLRLQQIELALERWRWMPDDSSERYIVVNIPEFRVRVFDRDAAGDHYVLAMDIIVGEARKRRYTPVFTATMNEVIFRPYWDVPVRIARNEETPKIRQRSGYFESEEMEIVTGYEEDVVRYPPTPANLAKVDAGTLRLRQRPGDKNALGLVKFVFPNEYNTYLHGTPAQSLFNYARRDFSHGCMRLRDPAALAEVVLKREGGWDREQIDSAMHGERTMHVNLSHTIPVFVLYLTAMPDSTGDVHFSPDIYRHDVALARALSQRLPETDTVMLPTRNSGAVRSASECDQAPTEAIR
jgi:murein L,D-transpeptidase YcbB/YkuD